MLPKSYSTATDRKYPVVYMLHGAGENDWEWANIAVSMISEAITMITNDGTAAECIVVFPNANEAGHMGRYGPSHTYRFRQWYTSVYILPPHRHYGQVRSNTTVKC